MSRLPKFNGASKIPNPPKTNIPSASSVVDLNKIASTVGRTMLQNKVTASLRAPLSRRSKSAAELRLMRPPMTKSTTVPSVALNKPSTTFTRPTPSSLTTTTTIKRPVKRPGAPLTENQPLRSKAKPSPPKKAPVKSITAKPAPYDYKARFALLKEQHDKLKTTHRDLKESHDDMLDQHENLVASNTQLTTDLTKATTELQTIKSEFSVLKKNHSQLNTDFLEVKEQLDTAQSKLKVTENRLNEMFEDYSNIKLDLQTKTSKLEQTTTDLEFNKTLVANMKQQLYQLDIDKRKLHNEIQDLKGNIRVFCRVRPYLHEERHKLLSTINFPDEKSIELSKGKESIEPTGKPRMSRFDFSFDRVFSPNSSQEDIFTELAQLVQSVLDGYNVCVFAYGQTGSGKTYTMEGGNSDTTLGMIPRAIDLIFDSFEPLERLGWKYTIKASFLEIYNETIVDLLNPKRAQHDIRMTDSKGTDIYVTNLTIETISCAEELKKYMKIAQRNRAVAATENNDRSSRSHSVAKILLEGYNEERNEKLSGSLNLIDLAGSERMHSSELNRLNETKNINKSLANLGNVILALVQKQDHIPYRNSKLTHLLMPCLGGNSKTLMLVNISPFEDCFGESVNSLRFASNVNQCKTGNIKRNRMMQSSSMTSLII